MERERLARQKRLRPDVTAPASSSDDEEESQELEKKDEDGEERDAKRRKLNVSADAGPSVSRQVQRDVPVVSQATPPSRNEVFLDEEVRPTWISIAPNDTRKRFKIQDVIGDVSFP
jgi:tyrosyl-DNA phosphodiesterase-1